MFENFLGNLKEKFRQSQERKEEEKRELDRMQREVDFERKRVFQEEYLKNAKAVAIGQAKKEAASKSGIQKLRAENRLRRLQDPDSSNPSNFFANFSAYTQKNIAKREENLKRTKAIREEAEKMKGEKKSTFQPAGIRKPFQPSGFGRR